MFRESIIMAKKKRKTVKVEIPVPDLSSPKLNNKHIKKAAKSLDDFHGTMQKNTKNLVYLAVIVVAVVAIYSFSGALQVDEEELSQEPQFRTVTDEIHETLSFSDYMENFRAYDGSSVTLKGMLSYKLEAGSGQGTLGVYVYRLVDDMGNEIGLSSLTSQQRTLFVRDVVTEEVFEVTGTIEVDYMDFEIAVESITPAERDVSYIQRQVPI